MTINRRDAIRMLGSAGVLLSNPSWAQRALKITRGPFTGTRDSLKSYRTPDWFGDAKFGIWSHWGPQSAVGDGDWYARNMYIEGTDQYKYHRQRFGPQSKVGYKNLIPLYTADRWNPDALMDLYVKAGARYFFSMGVHHDNYDLWNSHFQPRWNAVNSGPRKDVVGLWARAARKRGLRFGVSEHLSNSFDWLAPSHGRDKAGEYAGVPYDGSDPAFADLYHSYIDEPPTFAANADAMGRDAPERWKQRYLDRVKDLIDQHQPDLLYTDGGIPFEQYGLALVAEQYNVSAARHHGHVESIYFSKREEECATGTCVLDRERGVADGIRPEPWQSDTCIGNWHYKKGIQYKSVKKVIDLLVDIVSKNGNLLLNFPLPASGELDPEERTVLSGVTRWTQTNGEGIFESRPWKIHGEGPSLLRKPGGGMNEDKLPDLTLEDVRFTTKPGILYAFVQGRPVKEFSIRSLGSSSPHGVGRITSVEMLGASEKLSFKQTPGALRVQAPASLPPGSEVGVALRIRST